MTVRTAKIEIFGFSKSVNRDNWRQLAISCQEMTNRLWEAWLVHHVVNKSAMKLKSHFEAFNKWKETKEGEKPHWPCKALESPLTDSKSPDSFYRILSSEFPHVTSRTRGLLTQAWQSKLNKRKSAKGNLPGWVAILFHAEGMPSFKEPQPIPFDYQNAKLYRDEDKYMLELRVERLTEDGKSVVEPCELILNKRKTASVRSIVDKLLKGEYEWKGSNLIYDRGKWFASIAYEMPDKVRPELNKDKVLFIRPGRKGPWRCRIDNGRSFFFGGNGKHVEFARRAIERERDSRKSHYRWAGANQKGSGGERARSVWTKLSSRWKDFTKRYNNEVSRRLIELAIKTGCGKIVYFQPDGNKSTRYLAGGCDSAMSWDYFQFGTMLAYKCEHEGVGFEKRNTNAADRVPRVRQSDSSKRGKRSKRQTASV